MAFPTLTPASQTSKSVLPVTGSPAQVAAALPYGIYAASNDFLSGAADQVAYTYRKLGGDVLDIELNSKNVYANYEEAVLEYSYILNLHQGKNILSDVLGQTTGTFDQDGQSKTGPSNVNLKFPRVMFEYARRVGDSYSTEATVGGTVPIYSASIKLKAGQQDYDLQSIISASSATGLDSTGKSASYAEKWGKNELLFVKFIISRPMLCGAFLDTLVALTWWVI